MSKNQVLLLKLKIQNEMERMNKITEQSDFVDGKYLGLEWVLHMINTMERRNNNDE
jgi:hypothetical protein